MSAVHEIFSKSEHEHVITWPDGYQAVVHGPWRIALEIGQARAMVTELRATIYSTQRELQCAKESLRMMNDGMQRLLDSLTSFVEP